jgi:Transposase DDE domain
MGTIRCPCRHLFSDGDIPSPYEYNLIPDTAIEELTKAVIETMQQGQDVEAHVGYLCSTPAAAVFSAAGQLCPLCRADTPSAGPLVCYLHTGKDSCTGIAFIDSAPLAVCHHRRIATHKVLDGWTSRGKTSLGWCYGFTLALIVNDRGELLAFQRTPGHVDDRKPVPTLTPGLFGQLLGDRGSISQAFHDALWGQGLELLTNVRRNMKNRLRRLWDKLMLRQRSLIEMWRVFKYR